MLSSQLDQESAAFQSKAFLIRYCEEEVEINDVVLFRAELTVQPEYLSSEFTAVFDLYFADISELGGPQMWKQNYQKLQKEAEFQLVQTQSLVIKNVARGVCEHCPLVFQGGFFSLLQV